VQREEVKGKEISGNLKNSCCLPLSISSLSKSNQEPNPQIPSVEVGFLQQVSALPRLSIHLHLRERQLGQIELKPTTEVRRESGKWGRRNSFVRAIGRTKEGNKSPTKTKGESRDSWDWEEKGN